MKARIDMGLMDNLRGKVKASGVTDNITSISRKALENWRNANKREQTVEQTFQQEQKDVLQQERELDQQYHEKMTAIKKASDDLNRQIQEQNTQRDIQKKRAELKALQRENMVLREQTLNRVAIENSFSFYKVNELLTKQQATLQQALTMAGCPENCEYDLTYEGDTFIRLEDSDVDNVATSVIQNLKFNQYLGGGNAVVIALGTPKKTTYSIGYLVYDKEFGFMLLKNDRYIGTYPTDTVDRLMANKKLNDRAGFFKKPLSSTFIKMAAPAAFCINISNNDNHFVETEEDLKQIKEMAQYNQVAFKRMLNAFEFFMVKLNRNQMQFICRR